jgi:tRNA(fMet)-specific endonuclease VapC
MYILDTDHISILDRSGPAAQPLFAKLVLVNPNQFATTIITYEEQMRGWLSYMDLKIAAIAIVNQSTLLTRNSKDFSQIRNLSIEDWTT